MTRRLPERMLLGSVAVPDIVLAHRVSNPDRVTGGARRPLAVAAAVAPAATRTSSSHDIPKGGPRPVGFGSHRNNLDYVDTTLVSTLRPSAAL